MAASTTERPRLKQRYDAEIRAQLGLTAAETSLPSATPGEPVVAAEPAAEPTPGTA